MVTENSLVLIKPDADIEVMSFYNEALKLKQYASERIIAQPEDLKPASDDLSIIAKVKKSMEEKRKDYIKPFQEHVKDVNERFKELMEPIEQADKITRQKILAYQAEQERIRREQEEINRKRLEAAEAEMKLKGEISEPVNLVEVAPEAPHKVSTDMGTTGTRENWKWELEDITLVPKEYLMINAGMLTPIVKASKGKINIPGIRIYNEPTLAVNTR